MTEYQLPDNKESETTEGQMPLVVVPRPEHEYQSMKTWKDLEPPEKSAGDTPELPIPKPLARALGKLMIKSPNARGERDNFISTLRWVPYSKNEATIALKRLDNQVAINRRTKQGSAERAAQQPQTAADSFRTNALGNLSVLKEVLPTLEDAEPKPSVAAIREHDEVRKVLAKFMLAKESLDEYRWPLQRTNHGLNKKTQQRLQGLNESIDQSPDEAVSRLWHMAFRSNQYRLRFWSGEVDRFRGIDTEPWDASTRMALDAFKPDGD